MPDSPPDTEESLPENVSGTPLLTALNLSNQSMMSERISAERKRLQELMDKAKALDEQYVEDLRDNAQKMKDKEQSTENKLLGGLSIGVIGAGGMQMASGLAEQKADTGLYDNVGMGRQSGAYTSLSRALTDETSKDAEEWAKQKADANDTKKRGTAMAVGGAVASAAANMIINKDSPRESSGKITAEHKKDRAENDSEIAKINENIAQIESTIEQITTTNQAAIDEYNKKLARLQEILNKLLA